MHFGTPNLLAALAVTYLVLGWTPYVRPHELSQEFHPGYQHGDHPLFHQQKYDGTPHGHHPYSHPYRRHYQHRSFYFGYHHRQGGFYFGPSRHYGCTYTSIRAPMHGGRWAQIISSNCY